MASNPADSLLHRLKVFAEHAHLWHWFYLGVVIVAGWLGDAGWFWIMTLAPLTLAALLLIQAEFQARPEEWWWPFDWPWWGSIPLDVAAKRAFGRLEGTEWARVALMERHEEERLDIMAAYLIGESPRLLARRPPASHEEFSGIALRIGEVRGGGKTLHMMGNDLPFREDLRIERSVFWQAIKSMRHKNEGLAR
jgi:hypothetical protein